MQVGIADVASVGEQGDLISSLDEQASIWADLPLTPQVEEWKVAVKCHVRDASEEGPRPNAAQHRVSVGVLPNRPVDRELKRGT